jgi:hypothetical protein
VISINIRKDTYKQSEQFKKEKKAGRKNSKHNIGDINHNQDKQSRVPS